MQLFSLDKSDNSVLLLRLYKRNALSEYEEHIYYSTVPLKWHVENAKPILIYFRMITAITVIWSYQVCMWYNWYEVWFFQLGDINWYKKNCICISEEPTGIFHILLWKNWIGKKVWMILKLKGFWSLFIQVYEESTFCELSLTNSFFSTNEPWIF